MRKTLLVTFLALLMAVPAVGAEWKGKWIMAADCPVATNTWQAFRKEITLAEKPKSLKARISVDSKYWLWINGKMVVFEGQLKRGPSPEDSYFDVVELAPYLKKGNNLIAVLTWYYGREGFSHKSSGKPCFLFDAQGDGTEIISDDSWEARHYAAFQTCKTETPNFRLPESAIRFEGSEDMGDWFSPKYDKHFPKAKVEIQEAVNDVYGKLVERNIPLFRFGELKKYEWVKKDEAKNMLVCRLPYNAQVTPWIKVKAASGKVIDIRTENFKVGTECSVHAEYVTRDGVLEYENLGWMSGNEVHYTIPQGVEVLDVKYRESGYDTDIVGSFECNDPFWNELWKRSARTMYVNMRDTYFDCPERERAQWWGDITNDIMEDFYVLSPSSWQIITKGIYEIANWQRADGTIFSPIPAGNWGKELPCQMLAAVGKLGFYTQYYYSGDNSFVAPVYDRIHRYLHGVWKLDADGFTPERKGGWSFGDWGSNIDIHLLTNEWYFMALDAETKFAEMLGKTEDANQNRLTMNKMKQNFDKVFWTGNGYRSPLHKGQTDDRAQGLAVVSGLAGKDKYGEILKIFKTNHFASPWMEYFVQLAMFQMGSGREALERARIQYTPMMNMKDQTTVFEQWEAKNGTINHAWAAGMVVAFGHGVCGIHPTSPGFKTFEVVPQMSGLKWVKTQMQTKYGFIKLALKQNGTRLKVDITVPEGTSAQVRWNGHAQNVSAGKHSLDL